MKPYPLQWPDGMPRHKGTRESGQFRSSLNAALENARKSLAAFGRDTGIQIRPESIIFSSNVGGLGVSRPEDPGIALWFEWDGATRCIAVDRYSKPEANLQAIHHIIEADRTKLRHGSLEIIRTAYRGFIALPSPDHKRTWREVLEIEEVDYLRKTVTTDDVRSAWKRLSRIHHPDNPEGSTELMAEINTARDEALKELERPPAPRR